MNKHRYESDPLLDYELLGPASNDETQDDMLICVFNKNDNNDFLKKYISFLKKEYSVSQDSLEKDNV